MIKNLTLLHSNDLHGDFLAENIDEKLVGGVSRLSGYINETRRKKKNCLYCVAGDMFRGSLIDSEYQGLSTIEIMNLLAPDVVTLGNHEVDYGIAHLLFIEKCAKFPIINANMHIKTNHTRLFQPYFIKEIDGMRILFIGILTEETLSSTKNDGIIGTFVGISEAAAEIGKICNAHNATDIDLTVLLTHIGNEEDKKLAAMLDPAWGVDIIIGGHSHTYLEKEDIVNNIVVVQAGVGTDQIGRFDIKVDTDKNCIDSFKWSTIPIDEDHCPKDEQLEELITTYKNKTDEKYSRVITRFTHELTHPLREQETELGNLAADILKDATGLDIALVGSGSIRKEHMGPIVQLYDFMEVFPYDDPYYMLYVTGQQFKAMMKFMVRDEVWQGAHNEFYQLSKGINITYVKDDHEFEQFLYNGEPIEEDKVYTIGLPKFHYSSFDEFFNLPLEEVIKNGKPKVISTSINEILEEYFSENPLIDAQIEGRLIVK